MNRTYSPKAGEVEQALVRRRRDRGTARPGLHAHRTRADGQEQASVCNSHIDTGDFVVVINAEKVILTGRKETRKVYYRHSTHPGGLKRGDGR